jgi:hypothetical protein
MRTINEMKDKKKTPKKHEEKKPMKDKKRC